MERTRKKGRQFASDTSDRTLKDWGKAICVLLAGLIIAHLGVTLFLLSELGTDTFTVLIQGLARAAGLSVGTMHVIVLCALTVLMLLFTRGYVKPGTVVCAFCGGPIIDFFTWILGDSINSSSGMAVRIVSMVAGCIILAAGMSVVINSNAGTGPNDLVAIILSDELSFAEFRWVRVGCDVVFVALGYLLGGTVGAGTIAAVVLTGPLVQFWLPITQKAVHRWVSRPDEKTVDK